MAVLVIGSNKSGLPAPILRRNYFFQNDGEFVAKKEAYPMPIGSVGVSMVDIRDIAEVAAVYLLERENSMTTLPTKSLRYTVPMPHKRFRNCIVVTRPRKPVVYLGDDLRAAEARFGSEMSSAMAYDSVTMFRSFHRYGMVADPNAMATVSKLLGRPLRTYEQYVNEVGLEK